MSYGTFPDPSDMQWLVAAANATLIDTCAILRPQPGLDSTGAPTMVRTQVASGVHCRLLPIGAEALRTREQVAAGALFDTTVFLLIVALGTDIKHTDQIVIHGQTLEPAGDEAIRSRRVSIHVLVKFVTET